MRGDIHPGAQFKTGDCVSVDPMLSTLSIGQGNTQYKSVSGQVGIVVSVQKYTGGNGMPCYLVRFSPTLVRELNQEWLHHYKTGLDIMLEMVE